METLVIRQLKVYSGVSRGSSVVEREQLCISSWLRKSPLGIKLQRTTHKRTGTHAHAHRCVEAAETEQGPQPGQRYRPDVTEDATTRRGRVEGTRDLVY